MKIVEELINGATADVEVLRSLDSQGDDFSTFREVDFLILAPSKEKAEVISGFINDYHYGHASIRVSDGAYQVLVLVQMPVTQSVIACVAGFMTCVAQLYGGSMDGWGCAPQRKI
jgi:hypothetical protein